MKEIKEPVLILILLFILVGFIYSPVKRANMNRNANGNSISNTSSTVGNAGTDVQNTKPASNIETAETIKKAEQEAKKLQENLRTQEEEAKRSPYYGKVNMSGISGVYYQDPASEYISIYTSLDKGETVNITGWYLKSEVTQYYAVIGKVALLPFPFTHTESDIVLQQGDRVIIGKGFSPIGISFRTNKCTGYFEENRTFIPNLSLECPLPRDEQLPKFSTDYDRNDECIDLIAHIPRCTTRGNEYLRDLPDTVTRSCKDYMSTQVNYNTCVSKHFSDTDFPGHEYRVYLNKFGALWRQKREKITLYDRTGLVVDSVSY